MGPAGIAARAASSRAVAGACETVASIEQEEHPSREQPEGARVDPASHHGDEHRDQEAGEEGQRGLRGRAPRRRSRAASARPGRAGTSRPRRPRSRPRSARSAGRSAAAGTRAAPRARGRRSPSRPHASWTWKPRRPSGPTRYIAAKASPSVSPRTEVSRACRLRGSTGTDSTRGTRPPRGWGPYRPCRGPRLRGSRARAAPAAGAPRADSRVVRRGVGRGLRRGDAIAAGSPSDTLPACSSPTRAGIATSRSDSAGPPGACSSSGTRARRRGSSQRFWDLPGGTVEAGEGLKEALAPRVGGGGRVDPDGRGPRAGGGRRQAPRPRRPPALHLAHVRLRRARSAVRRHAAPRARDREDRDRAGRRRRDAAVGSLSRPPPRAPARGRAPPRDGLVDRARARGRAPTRRPRSARTSAPCS